PDIDPEAAHEAAIQIKYEGYIKQQLNQVKEFKKLENRLLPENIDYSTIKGLRLEAAQKLNDIKPLNIGHAFRIAGVSPADISVLMIYMEQLKRESKEN
ncbi:MAG: tRNA uridine-5-carboxymethylaminomethyl(34) synthesis enzyme MnmG, partial [Ruminococcaceae bacterium]|nr:tRNA uridine-5-carboxymethylaminomethyl(34) synthesis enzyme MnmG [Oscillospiraceae bacterium]